MDSSITWKASSLGSRGRFLERSSDGILPSMAAGRPAVKESKIETDPLPGGIVDSPGPILDLPQYVVPRIVVPAAVVPNDISVSSAIQAR